MPRCILGCRCIVHIANWRWFVTPNDTKYNGSYGAPATFVLRETLRSWAFRSTMSDLATAEALVATYGRGPWSKRIQAELVGLQAPRECLIPGNDLHRI